MKKRILIVDDEQELVKALQIRLGAAGYEVIVAYDGKKGLEKAQEGKPNLILLDILMPEMDGFETLEKLKQDRQTKTIPVIILTAKSQLEDVTRTTNLGAENYIVKPFDYIAMMEKIKKALRLEA
ncbi:MAG: response regulator [Candidatus Omnitrophica bacterium]|nr:response regulator [Candidatus Omnitrophota bacterium]